jgi:hypothetical protein
VVVQPAISTGLLQDVRLAERYASLASRFRLASSDAALHTRRRRYIPTVRSDGADYQRRGDMFCPKCGAQFPDSSNFCPKCGEKISPEMRARANKGAVKENSFSSNVASPASKRTAGNYVVPNQRVQSKSDAPGNQSLVPVKRPDGNRKATVMGKMPAANGRTGFSYATTIISVALSVVVLIALLVPWVTSPAANYASSTMSTLYTSLTGSSRSSTTYDYTIPETRELVSYVDEISETLDDIEQEIDSSSSSSSGHPQEVYLSNPENVSPSTIDIVYLVAIVMWVASLCLIILGAILYVIKNKYSPILVVGLCLSAVLGIAWVIGINSANDQIMSSINSLLGTHIVLLQPTAAPKVVIAFAIAAVVVVIIANIHQKRTARLN